MEIYATAGQIIHLGRTGEHLTTKVIFDVSEWKSQFRNQTLNFDLIVTPAGSKTTYIPPIKEVGDTVVWEVRRSDLRAEYVGLGQCELRYTIANTDSESESVIEPVVINNYEVEAAAEENEEDTSALNIIEEEDLTFLKDKAGELNSSLWIRLEEAETGGGNEDNEEDNSNNNLVGKSVIYDTLITRSLSDTGEEVPEAAEGWVDKVLNASLDARNYMILSKSWTVGQTNGSRDGEDTDNAKYYAEQASKNQLASELAKDAAELAQSKAEDAQNKAEDAQNKAEENQAEAENAQNIAQQWAVGTVEEGEAPSDTNNSKYYSKQSENFANNAQGSAVEAQMAQVSAEKAKEAAAQSETDAELHAISADDSAEVAEAWAVGTRKGSAVLSSEDQYQNNAKYYAEQASEDAENAHFDMLSSEVAMNEAIDQAYEAQRWATGKIGNHDVSEEEPQYRNNARYWANYSAEYGTNPAKPINGTWWIWDVEEQDYVDTGMKAVLSVTKAYASVTDMNNHFADHLEGEMVIIHAPLIEEDNAKLYVRGATAWEYLTDLSGYEGTGIARIEDTNVTHTPGQKDIYTIVLTDSREQEIEIYNGADGNGITSVSRTSGTGAPGTEDIYTIKFTKTDDVTFSVHQGEDAFSPEISVTDISGGHRVTITDKDGVNTFDVMNGEGSGDMLSNTYDPENIVANAGGIVNYVEGAATKISIKNWTIDDLNN